MKVVPVMNFFMGGKLVEGTNKAEDAFDLEDEKVPEFIQNGRVRALTEEELAGKKKRNGAE